MTAPCMIVVCRICHASPARGVFQTADGFGCIAPQHRCPWRAGAYRRNSPSSLWEGVSKFHYPPRCPRARFANTGSKAALIARPACPSPPELAVVAAHLTSLGKGNIHPYLWIINPHCTQSPCREHNFIFCLRIISVYIRNCWYTVFLPFCFVYPSNTQQGIVHSRCINAAQSLTDTNYGYKVNRYDIFAKMFITSSFIDQEIKEDSL